MNVSRALAVGIVLCAVLTGVPQAQADGGDPVDGVWLTDGYGSVIEVADGHAQSYDTTKISCAKATDSTRTGPGRFANEDFEFTLRPDRRGQHAVMRIDSSVGERHLRRLTALPDLCRVAVPTSRIVSFDVFWATFAENYPFFAAKGVDCAAVRARYRPSVRENMTDGEFFDLLTEMVAPLRDAHVVLRAGDRRFVAVRPGTTFPTLAQEDAVRAFVVRRDLDGKPLQEFGNKRIGYAELPGRIGYLRVSAFAGYTGKGYAADAVELDRALDTVLPKGAAALHGLIIDLRINGGGDDPHGIRIAQRLTRQPYLAYTKQARDDADNPTRFTKPQPRWVFPERNKPAHGGPLVVLTGGSTLSAGETFTQALLGRTPRPVLIGENTQGVFSDTLDRTLPNGWRFTLPNERYLTRSGHTFDGTGIPPHIRTPVFTDEEFAADRDSAFDRAVDLLRHEQ